jgi:hypothetical protein
VTIGAGAGTVGVEVNASTGVQVNGTQTNGYANSTVNVTVSPVLPIKIGGEIKVNIIEFQVKPPEKKRNRK